MDADLGQGRHQRQRCHQHVAEKGDLRLLIWKDSELTSLILKVKIKQINEEEEEEEKQKTKEAATDEDSIVLAPEKKTKRKGCLC